MADETEGASKAIAITRFTVTGEPEQFERAFLAHSEFVRAQPGFRQFQALRSVLSSKVYVNVGWWSDLESYQKVLASPRFQADAGSMAALVTVEPYLTTKVANGLAIRTEADGEQVQGYSDERLVVLTRYTVTGDADAFAAEFKAHTESRRKQDGFIFHEGVRAVNQPAVFLNLEWWMDAAAYRKAVEGEQLRTEITAIEKRAVIDVDQAHNFANGEPITS
ncbi:antibiotic biosynthesis monooxygenase family protein [Kutzneria sp. NPDC051319]|uniref:antibiotic biosynthesis monooxygenase family protein n=1 Tax=Kutzneria sp. NPDC051319 TaxID=3155047 RepID=UPI00341DC843